MTTINSMQDFSRLLREHPDWRDELRRLLLTDELLELPQRFADYAEVTDKRLDALVAHAVETDKRLDALVTQAEVTNRRLDALERDVKTIQRDIGDLKGIGLQTRLQHVGVARISTMFKLRNCRSLGMAETNRNSLEFNDALMNAEEDGVITEADYDRLMDTDMVVRGSIRGASTIVYTPIEATYTIHRADITKLNHSIAVLKKVFPDADVRGVLYYFDAADYIEYEAQEEGIGLIKENRLR